MEKVEELKRTFKNLESRKVSSVCSVGSNIFIEWGKYIEFMHSNGKPCKRKEWVFWFSFPDWRITCEDQYVLSSEVSHKAIAEKISCMLGKRLESIEVISNLMDLELTFERGYKLASFIHCFEKKQWAIFSPKPHFKSPVVACMLKKDGKKVKELIEYFPFRRPYRNEEIKEFAKYFPVSRWKNFQESVLYRERVFLSLWRGASFYYRPLLLASC